MDIQEIWFVVIEKKFEDIKTGILLWMIFEMKEIFLGGKISRKNPKTHQSICFIINTKDKNWLNFVKAQDILRQNSSWASLLECSSCRSLHERSIKH